MQNEPMVNKELTEETPAIEMKDEVVEAEVVEEVEEAAVEVEAVEETKTADEVVAAEAEAEDKRPDDRVVKVRKKRRVNRIYAGFFVRLTAFLIDKVIVAIPLGFIRLLFWMSGLGRSSHILAGKVFFSFTVMDLVLYLISVAYFIILTYSIGMTIGKKIMRIKVVSAFDRKPTFFEIFFRETFGRYLSAIILYIGYLIIGAGDEKQALHDYLADTRVVYADFEK